MIRPKTPRKGESNVDINRGPRGREDKGTQRDSARRNNGHRGVLIASPVLLVQCLCIYIHNRASKSMDQAGSRGQRQYVYTKECWHQLASSLCNYADPVIDWLDPQWDDFNPFMENCPCDAAPQADVSERPAIEQIPQFDVGSCNYVEWLEKFRLCEDNLVASMCHNPDTTLQQCATGEIGGNFTTCGRQSFRTCFASAGVPEEQVEQQVDARMSDPMISNTTWFCQMYGLDFALPWQNYGPMCNFKFTDRNTACLKPLLDMWSDNPADPRICREFRTTKDCWHRNINQNCLLDVGLKAITDWFDSQFDDYNPFEQCPCVLHTSQAGTVHGTYTVLSVALLVLLMTPWIRDYQ